MEGKANHQLKEKAVVWVVVGAFSMRYWGGGEAVSLQPGSCRSSRITGGESKVQTALPAQAKQEVGSWR